VDAHALAVELVPGERLAVVPQGRENGAANHTKLREIVERVHGAGLFHLDLRGRDNVLFGHDGQVYIIDLASAIWFRPGGWMRRLFARWFAMTDQAALLKWKTILGAGTLTEEEQAFLNRYRYWRALWIFNRKRPPRA
jgi:hypothetical protein